jgi:hypothetical protein
VNQDKDEIDLSGDFFNNKLSKAKGINSNFSQPSTVQKMEDRSADKSDFLNQLN